MELYQNPHKMMQRGVAVLRDTKTVEEVRQLIRTAILQERDFKAMMLGASCEKMAIKSEGSTQAFEQALAWLADVEA